MQINIGIVVMALFSATKMVLLLPDGPLSTEVPASSIVAANKAIKL